ncbi:MAG TPA: aldolase [Mesorhizobium sp.]|jgi:ribulose-5-phosphate 4-epimerase/fuculose-1-phosphate aldolase
MNQETELRASIVKWGRSIFERGLTSGSSGNISVRLDDRFLMTPTNSCLGFLEADKMSLLDSNGTLLSGDKPTKELPLHFAFYRSRPAAKAVVHLHSTYATALSCLEDVDCNDAIPAITPYVVMRVGNVPVLPYTKPGAKDAEPMIFAKAADHAAILLGNHGPVVAGRSLEDAVFIMEELEEAAKLIMITRGMNVRLLNQTHVNELNRAYPLK